MDFYEALKSGTSEAELLKSFTAALNEAKDKLKKEEAAKAELEAKKADLEKRRTALAAAIYDYAKAFYGEDVIKYTNLDEINKILLDFETQNEKFRKIKDKLQMNYEWSKLPKLNKEMSFSAKADQEIIDKFIKSLKFL